MDGPLFFARSGSANLRSLALCSACRVIDPSLEATMQNGYDSSTRAWRLWQVVAKNSCEGFMAADGDTTPSASISLRGGRRWLRTRGLLTRSTGRRPLGWSSLPGAPKVRQRRLTSSSSDAHATRRSARSVTNRAGVPAGKFRRAERTSCGSWSRRSTWKTRFVLISSRRASAARLPTSPRSRMACHRSAFSKSFTIGGTSSTRGFRRLRCVPGTVNRLQKFALV
jgi:hypothetical protein